MTTLVCCDGCGRDTTAVGRRLCAGCKRRGGVGKHRGYKNRVSIAVAAELPVHTSEFGMRSDNCYHGSNVD